MSRFRREDRWTDLPGPPDVPVAAIIAARDAYLRHGHMRDALDAAWDHLRAGVFAEVEQARVNGFDAALAVRDEQVRSGTLPDDVRHPAERHLAEVLVDLAEANARRAHAERREAQARAELHAARRDLGACKAELRHVRAQLPPHHGFARQVMAHVPYLRHFTNRTFG
jgi:hypothetical protein